MHGGCDGFWLERFVLCVRLRLVSRMESRQSDVSVWQVI
jgi:hypothetical protein